THVRLAVLRLRRVRVDGRVPGPRPGPVGGGGPRRPAPHGPGRPVRGVRGAVGPVEAGGGGGGAGVLPALGNPVAAARGGRTLPVHDVGDQPHPGGVGRGRPRPGARGGRAVAVRRRRVPGV